MYIAMEVGIGIGALVSAYIFANEAANISLAFNSGALFSGIAFLYVLFVYKNKTEINEV